MATTRSRRSLREAQAASSSLKKRLKAASNNSSKKRRRTGTARSNSSKKKPKKESGRDWMALPQGPLFLISEQLQSEIDVVRFRSVCTSWRSAAPRRQSPLVLVKSNRQSDYFDALLALSGARIPDIPDIRVDRPCCSSCGLLGDLVSIISSGLHSDTTVQPITLFNPITMDHIDLPFITGLDSIDYFRMLLILSSNPATTSEYTGAILCDHKLAIYRSGDKAWSVTPFPESGGIFFRFDIAFYRGLIYVAAANRIFVFDPAADSKLAGAIPVPCVDGKSSESCCRRDLDNCRCLGLSSFLVESCGDLLLVRHNLYSTCDEKMGEVLKLQFCDGRLLRGMVKIESSLGDRALFVARGCSFSLSATKLPEYKGNHIYFMDERYIKAYGLADGKVNRTSPDLNCWPGAWFRPHLM